MARGHDVTLVDPVETKLPLLDRLYKEYEKGSAPKTLKDRNDARYVRPRVAIDAEGCRPAFRRAAAWIVERPSHLDGRTALDDCLSARERLG
jgi:hypothetical protein